MNWLLRTLGVRDGAPAGRERATAGSKGEPGARLQSEVLMQYVPGTWQKEEAARRRDGMPESVYALGARSQVPLAKSQDLDV